MRFFKYIVTISSDTGIYRIHTVSTDFKSLIALICKMQLCPEFAILNIKRGREIK